MSAKKSFGRTHAHDRSRHAWRGMPGWRGNLVIVLEQAERHQGNLETGILSLLASKS